MPSHVPLGLRFQHQENQQSSRNGMRLALTAEDAQISHTRTRIGCVPKQRDCKEVTQGMQHTAVFATTPLQCCHPSSVARSPGPRATASPPRRAGIRTVLPYGCCLSLGRYRLDCASKVRQEQSPKSGNRLALAAEEKYKLTGRFAQFCRTIILRSTGFGMSRGRRNLPSLCRDLKLIPALPLCERLCHVAISCNAQPGVTGRQHFRGMCIQNDVPCRAAVLALFMNQVPLTLGHGGT